MGMVLIYGLIFLLAFSIIAFGLLFFSIKRKSKIGLIISIFMIILVILALFTNTIDEITISKSDVVQDLSILNIELKDNFKITENNVHGMPERFQETSIQISQKDKERIITEIRSSKNFKSFANEQEVANYTENNEEYMSDEIFNFKYPEFYSKEIWTEIDNFPTRLYVSIYDNSNIISYQRLED